MNLIYNIDFDIAGFIILVILNVVLKTLYSTNKKNNKVFHLLLTFSIYSAFFDIITAITNSNCNFIPTNLNLILNTVYFLITLISSFLGFLYISLSVKEKPKFLLYLTYTITSIYFILLIINIFTGFIFTFKNQYYEKGILYYLVYAIPCFFILEVAFLLFYNIKHLSKKQFILNSGYFIFPIIFVSIQIIYPNILFSNFSFAIAILVMLFAIETPDFIELEFLRNNLELEVRNKTDEALNKQKEIENMSFRMIQILAQTLDEKDVYTKGHSSRVSAYSVMLAEELGWPSEKNDKLKEAALLHDIGKIGIPDSVLKKSNKLSEDEYNIIKTHTTKGGAILHNVSSNPEAETVAKYHHEWYDGSGYPGIHVGKNIPEFARIVAITDAYDAMATKRPYREKLPKDVIKNNLLLNRGTQFDPDYLDVFISMLDRNLIN